MQKRLKIWQDGDLVAHFVPCQPPEGSPTLYDLVSGNTATAQGTADFTAGPHDAKFEINGTGVYGATVTPQGRTAFAVAAEAVLLGDDVGSAHAVRFVWGHTPDRLVYTNDVASVTESKKVSADLSGRVLPGYANYGKFQIETVEGVKDGADGVLAFAMPVTPTSFLPAGYQSLAYIESDGSQYIDTEVEANEDLAVDISFRTLSSVSAVFGSQWGLDDYLLCAQGTVFSFFESNHKICNYNSNTDYHFTAEKKDGVCRIGFAIGSDTALVYEEVKNLKGNGNLYLFATQGGANASKLRLYSCAMTVAGEQVRDYVPCQRESDGKVGLYDLKNGAFVGSANGKSFLAGPAAPLKLSRLTIEGSPEPFPTPDPDYGVYENLLPGDAFDCTAAPAVGSEDVRAGCTGYSYYTNACDGTGWVLVESGDETSFAYEHPADAAARLVWNYDTEYRVSVAAEAGGTASFVDGESEKWCAAGETSEIVAMPADGCTFVYWTGVPPAQSGENPLQLRPTEAGTVVAHFVEGDAAVWKGGAGGLASEPSNWMSGELPKDGDKIILPASVAEKPLVWDLKDVIPGGWVQNEGYTNTVTISTTYDDAVWPVFRVAGDVRLDDGAWTHARNPAASVKGAGTYRLRVEVAGSVTVGAGARIDVSGKGLPSGSGRDSTGGGASYGGRGYNSSGACYGSVKHPCDLGVGGLQGNLSTGCGGGCLMLTAEGAIRVDGAILADGSMSTIPNDTAQAFASSGGSIALTGASVTGSGRISANGGNMYTGWNYHSPGGGGRIAIIQTGEGTSYDTIPAAVSAYGSVNVEPGIGGVLDPIIPPGSVYKAGAGTIYLEVPDDEGRGRLVVRNRFSGTFSYDNQYLTELNDTMDQDLSFSSIEVAQGGCLAFLGGAATNLVGTVFLGDGQVQTFVDLNLGDAFTWSGVTVYPRGNCEVFARESTIVSGGIVLETAWHVPGDLTVAAGGCISHRAGGNDTNNYRVELAVDGDLTIDAGGAVDVTGKGYPAKTGINNEGGAGATAYGANFLPAHGGRGFCATKTATPYPPSYGSIFCPTNYGGSSNYAAGGGLIRLTVGGRLTLNGGLIAKGGPFVNSFCSGAGGSIYVTARTIVGSGRVDADGGDIWNSSGGGAGGRIALVLTDPKSTFDAFDDAVLTSVSARYNGNPVSSASGTIYLQRGDEKIGEGTLVIANDPNAQGDSVPATPIPMEEAALLKKTKLVIGPYAGAIIPVDMKVKDLTMTAETSMLDLGGHVLSVGSPWHAYPRQGVINAGEWIDGKKPGYANIKWGIPGLKILFY